MNATPDNLLGVRVRDLLFRAEVLTGRGRRDLRDCPATAAGEQDLRDRLRVLAAELANLADCLAIVAAESGCDDAPAAPADPDPIPTPEPELFAA